MKLELFDPSGKLVRRIVSGPRKEAPHPPLAIADRWLPKPEVLESTAGAHRYVWDLRWSSTGTSPEVEDEGFGAPHGPRVVPGTYQAKLTVDGATFSQAFAVQMDPRAQVTTAELNEQLRLGLEIFGDVRNARKVLAETLGVKKRLAEVKTKIPPKNTKLLTQVATLEAAIIRLEKGEKGEPGTIAGLEAAGTALSAALRVVESSDRAIPSQAVDLYQQGDRVAKSSIAEWEQLKSTQLVQLNDALKKTGVPAIQIAEVEREAEYQVSQ